ncbi:MAG: hypothetical protein E7536_02830 [Ruminococcaceae bacterium]|nr:hypothetical protein [Oscillospiraceae bacterium]
MKFIIRKAEEKDLASVLKLFENKADYPMAPPGKEKRKIFSDMLADTSRYLFVGERNGVICAFVSMKTEHQFDSFFKLSAYITDIKADCNDAEILTAVLSRATAVAMENGCNKIILSDKNITALSNSVYSICGFGACDDFYIKNL